MARVPRSGAPGRRPAEVRTLRRSASMTSSSSTSFRLRALALVALGLNVAFNAVYDRIGLPLRSVRAVSDEYQTLFTPAPYAFAIWGVLYTALAVYAIAALLPRQRAVRVHDRIAPPFIAFQLLASVWIAVFASGHAALSTAIVLVMLGVAMTMVQRAASGASEVRHGNLLLLPFTALLGWLSVAAIASVSQAGVALGLSPKLVAPAIAMLVVALLLGLAMAVRFADAAYLAVVCWASVALAVAQRGVADAFADLAIVVATASGLAVVSVLALHAYRALAPGLARHAPTSAT